LFCGAERSDKEVVACEEHRKAGSLVRGCEKKVKTEIKTKEKGGKKEESRGEKIH
jgi:hypothetical protein